jgi:hypothetical protein
LRYALAHVQLELRLGRVGHLRWSGHLRAGQHDAEHVRELLAQGLQQQLQLGRVHAQARQCVQLGAGHQLAMLRRW